MFSIARADVALFPILLGVWAAAIALAPTLEGKLILFAPGVVAILFAWLVHRPDRWLFLLFVGLFALPPLPIAGGDSGAHVGPIIGAIGGIVGLLRLRDWSRFGGPLAWAFGWFGAALLSSVVFAAFYSGMDIAIGSLARVVLFGLGVYVFAFVRVSETRESSDVFRFIKFLFVLASAAAAFACIDFYFQLPALAGFGAQFVWLPEGVMRRAQGLFYEASTLGNFCAFFLCMILICLTRQRSEIPISRPALAISGLIFGTALIFSYSRGSILNLAAASGALLWLRRRSHRTRKIWRRKSTAALVLGSIAALAALQTLVPSFFASYWARLVLSLQYASSSPDSILSGRLTSWAFLGDFLAREPWTAIFGIGYKTLPYSTYTGATVIADNTYLQLLVETGIFGLAAFLFLNAAILRTGFAASRSLRPQARLCGEWIFCFWIGQMVQMLSGDLITYWRVLPAYFWVLAIAARETRTSE